MEQKENLSLVWEKNEDIHKARHILQWKQIKSGDPYLDESELSPVDHVANWRQGSDAQEDEEEKSKDSQRQIGITKPGSSGTKRIFFLGYCLREITSNFKKLRFYKLPKLSRGLKTPLHGLFTQGELDDIS